MTTFLRRDQSLSSYPLVLIRQIKSCWFINSYCVWIAFNNTLIWLFHYTLVFLHSSFLQGGQTSVSATHQWSWCWSGYNVWLKDTSAGLILAGMLAWTGVFLVGTQTLSSADVSLKAFSHCKQVSWHIALQRVCIDVTFSCDTKPSIQNWVSKLL